MPLSPLLFALALSGASHAQTAPADDDLKFTLDGYYRVRLHHYNGLFDPDANWPNEPGAGRYTEQRLRLQPTVDYQGRAKFTMMADVFDGTLTGDNESRATTALFAEDPTNTSIFGDPGSMIAIKRAWMQFSTPLGQVRLGRQPSNWGMGLLANDGDGFKNTFGEAYGGATFDRFLFVTKPASVVQGIRKKDDPGIPLYFIFAIDRLVEDPLIQYYGYKCDPDTTEDDPRCGPTDDHSYTEPRDANYRPDNWWTENDDDVVEFVYGLIYRGESLDWGAHKSDFTLGFYSVNRKQIETASNVWILDGYTKLDYRKLYVESEAVTIRGHSSAIVLPGAVAEGSDDPLYKEPRIWSAVGRVGYQSQPFAATWETGFASGDDNVADERFSGRAITGEYNVGLILYDEVLERATRYRWTDAANGLWSGGGVYNSVYVFPNVRYTPIKNWDLHAAFLMAWPHKADGAIILRGPEAGDDAQVQSRALGWEADLALKSTWHDHILFSLEGGFAKVTDRIPYEDLGIAHFTLGGLDVPGGVYTVQTRLAYEF